MVALVPFLGGCGPAPITDSDAMHFHAAIDASNAGTRLTNRYVSAGTTPTAAERGEVLHHTRVALEHTRQVRDAALAAMHDDMRVMFRSRFERGLELIVRGIEGRRPDLMAEGHRHLDAWADWIESEGASIRFPPRPVTAP